MIVASTIGTNLSSSVKQIFQNAHSIRYGGRNVFEEWSLSTRKKTSSYTIYAMWTIMIK